MTVDEIVVRLIDDIGTEIPDIVSTVNTELRQLAMEWSWRYFEAYERIALTPAYIDGTVTVTADSAVVTGSGTTFTVGMVGRKFRVTGSAYVIASRESDTQITLDRAYTGETAAGQSYTIFQDTYSFPVDMRRLLGLTDVVTKLPLRIMTQAASLRWESVAYCDGVPSAGDAPWPLAVWGKDENGSKEFRLRYSTGTLEALDCHYWAWPQVATSIASTVDVAPYMEEALYARVKRRYVSRMPQHSEALIMARSNHMRETLQEYQAALMLAKSQDNKMTTARLRNARTVV